MKYYRGVMTKEFGFVEMQNPNYKYSTAKLTNERNCLIKRGTYKTRSKKSSIYKFNHELVKIPARALIDTSYGNRKNKILLYKDAL